MAKLLAVGVLCALLPSAEAFSAARTGSLLPASRLPASAVAMGPRAIHNVFTVEKATPEKLSELAVKNWGVWSTAGSAKYATGVKSPLKVYDGNELSYIISGKVEITPKATGVPVLVSAGDFVTFPDGFECYWLVIEEVTKHYYLY